MRIIYVLFAIVLLTGFAQAAELKYSVDEYTGVEAWEYDYNEHEISNSWEHDAFFDLMCQRDEDGNVILRLNYIRIGEEWLFPGALRANIYEGLHPRYRVYLPIGRYDENTMGFESEVKDAGVLMEHGSYMLAHNGGYYAPQVLDLDAMWALRNNYATWRLEDCYGVSNSTEDVWYSTACFTAVIDKYLELIGEHPEARDAADDAAASIKRGARE